MSPRIEPTVHVALLNREPDYTFANERSVRIACRGRKRKLVDMSRFWIETSELRDPLRGIPHAAIRRDNDTMRSRARCRRRIIGDFSGRRIRPPDETVLLIGVPDDSVRPDGRIMWETPRAESGIRPQRAATAAAINPTTGISFWRGCECSGKSFHPPAMRSLNSMHAQTISPALKGCRTLCVHNFRNSSGENGRG